MRTRIKVCGVTDIETVAAAVDMGVDAIGFVVTESPRQLSMERAAALIAAVPAYVTTVAVLRHPTVNEFDHVAEQLQPDLVQAEPHPDHGPERRRRLIPVFHDSEHVEAVIDAYHPDNPECVVHLEGEGRGGRGVAANRDTARAIASKHRLVLAGGLDPDNVGKAIEAVQPFAVDVSSGVESRPGQKDITKIRDFVRAVRDADQRGDT